MIKHRLAIITTHPIQYNAPLFRELSKSGSIELKVFYTWSQSEDNNKFDPDFWCNIHWDIPLMEGYNYEFIPNSATKPGSDHFLGIQNPTLVVSVKKFKPDALLVYGWNFLSHLKLMMYFKGKIPVWFRGDSTLLDNTHIGLIRRILRKLILSYVYRFIDKAFYVGSHNRAYFLEYGLKETQLIYAPHAIDNERFSNDDVSCNQIAEYRRLILGIAPSDKVILFVGKIEPKKNPEFLLKAFINSCSPNMHLIMAGDGPLKTKLLSVFEAHKNVHWLGFVNQKEIPVVYRMSDVVILPSIGPGETWGLCLNEAMASGRCIAASTSCGATIELVAERKTGWSFDPHTLSNLEDLFRLWSSMSRSELQALGRLAKEKIKNFQYFSFSQALEEELKNIRCL